MGKREYIFTKTVFKMSNSEEYVYFVKPICVEGIINLNAR